MIAISSIFNSMTGSFLNVTSRTMKNKIVVSGRILKRNYRSSPAQLMQEDEFKRYVSMMQCIRILIETLKFRKKGLQTSFNAFTKLNFPYFDGVTNFFLESDIPKIKFSSGGNLKL
jgi:hypothetical protein